MICKVKVIFYAKLLKLVIREIKNQQFCTLEIVTDYYYILLKKILVYFQLAVEIPVSRPDISSIKFYVKNLRV